MDDPSFVLKWFGLHTEHYDKMLTVDDSRGEIEYIEYLSYTVARLHGLPTVEVATIHKWCHDTFGPPGYNPLTINFEWSESVTGRFIIFGNEKNLMLFKLRW